ncbi:Bug family tripartite tricarboxylate transporter substrate binding protein [Pseudorhodoferax sp.]|uniref:Bug family tripartite tricarboxylate transporter substrate binding protein n=1 Tax=Pseudorhodoferax sp. TaxID=1993553 RepID=UPI0039E5015B
MKPLQFDHGRRAWLRHALYAGAAAGTSLLSGTAAAAAGDWPTRPVRLVVGVAAGSTGDTMLRMLAPRLEAVWKQPVIVENKPGGGGVVGPEYVVNSSDGHTFLLGTLSNVLPKYTVKNLRYDPETDLIPVYRVINYQTVFFATPETVEKARTLPGIVALSQSSPNGLFFAGTGPTSIFNMMMAVVNQTLGIRYTSVDFNSVPNMTLALLRGDAQIAMNAPNNVKAQIETGKLVPVAVVDHGRYPNLPDVPTIVEAVGYTGYMPLSWGGIFAPKNTPRSVVDTIARDLQAVLLNPEFKKDLETKLGGEVLKSSPAEFARDFTEDMRIWKGVVQSLNIVPQ